LLALLATILVTASAVAQRARPAAEWSPETIEALELYRGGDSERARRLAAAVMSRTSDPRVRRDAGAIIAMALLRGPARNDRIEGAARLVELAHPDPQLAERPDCLLAQGIAKTALSETAVGLDLLDRALRAYAAAGDVTGQLETLGELAACWAAHGEWESTPRRLGVRPPTDPGEAGTIRIEQIQRLRSEAERLRGDEEALARVDLALAAARTRAGDASAAAATLEAIAATPRMTRSVADAALQVAGEYESQGRWSEALRLYDRIAAAQLDERSIRARARAEALRRPALQLEVPASVERGARIPVQLTARNLPRISIELRRLDVEAWLVDRNTRGVEERLPESGALVAEKELDTRGAGPSAPWSSETLSEPLEFSADAGAYVLIARGADESGTPHTVKRFVVVSDLSAIGVTHGDHALVWAVRRTAARAGGADSAAPLTGRFWMRGSFAPAKLRFDRDLCEFRLPNEARVMRDRGWVCLVESDGDIAICRGTLEPTAASDSSAPAVAMCGAPSTLSVGHPWRLAGMLMRGLNDLRPPAEQRPLEVEVRDALDEVVARAALTVGPDGLFSTSVLVPAGQQGKRLRAIVRRGGAMVQNVLGPITVRVSAADEPEWDLACRAPKWLSDGAALFPAGISSEYPWGTPVGDADALLAFHTLRLPDANEALQFGQPLFSELETAQNGAAQIAPQLGEFPVPNGRMAIALTASVRGWDQRTRQASTRTLVAREPVYGWLAVEPTAPRIGDDVYFHVEWIDARPGGSGALPVVELKRDSQRVAALRLVRGEQGWRTESWRPWAPGAYAAGLIVDPADPLATMIARDLVVGDLPEGSASRPLVVSASFMGRDENREVHVRVHGDCAGPLLVCAATGMELVAREFAMTGARGQTEVKLQVRSGDAGGKVYVAGPTRAGAAILAASEIGPNPERGGAKVRLVTASPPLPASVISVRVEASPSPATALLRLAEVSGDGIATWVPHAERTDIAAARTGAPALPPALSETLQSGETIWAGTIETSETAASTAISLPAKPGLYRLLAVVRGPGDALGVDAVTLDTRTGVEPLLDVPRRMMLGDRIVQSLRLENRARESVALRVTLDFGDGLSVVSREVRGAPGRTETGAGSNPVELTVPPESRAWLIAIAEAARAGDAVARAVVESDRGRQQVELAYRVDDPAAGIQDASTTVGVERTVEVWRTRPLFGKRKGPIDDLSEVAWPASDPDAPLQPAGAPGAGEPARIALVPGEPLPPGRYLYVREQITFDQSASNVEWTQPLPATAQSLQTMPPELATLGPRQPGGLGYLSYRPTGPLLGSVVHEYAILTVRPGAAVLPPPEVRINGQRVAVELAPRETHVIVAEPR
jgi:tetratricopeptide (TPR) repeat protein